MTTRGGVLVVLSRLAPTDSHLLRRRGSLTDSPTSRPPAQQFQRTLGAAETGPALGWAPPPHTHTSPTPTPPGQEFPRHNHLLHGTVLGTILMGRDPMKTIIMLCVYLLHRILYPVTVRIVFKHNHKINLRTLSTTDGLCQHFMFLSDDRQSNLLHWMKRWYKIPFRFHTHKLNIWPNAGGLDIDPI